ncbi:MAG: hypothetical protein ABIB97_06020 [Patescibacteria group bacterium]
MKKIIFLTLAVFITIPAIALAQSYQAEVTVSKNEVVDRNLIRAAQTVTIEGRVDGDVIVAANEITISGRVGGDVIAAGNNIRITGSVEGNVRVAGNNVEIDANVGKNLIAFGNTINISEKASVAWSALIFGSTVNQRGQIGGHLDGGAVNFKIYGQVGGDSTIHLSNDGNLTLYEESEIIGTLTYKGETASQLTLKSGATVGEKEFVVQKLPSISWKALAGWGAGFYFFFKLVRLFGLLVVGLVLIALFHKKLYAITEEMLKKPAVYMGWGLVYLIVIPIILFLLLLTVIGIPLALIAGLLYGIVLYLTQIFAGLLIGKKVLQSINKDKEVSLTWAMIMGVFLYLILVSIPVIGWLVHLVAVIWILGAMAELLKKIKWQRTKK